MTAARHRFPASAVASRALGDALTDRPAPAAISPWAPAPPPKRGAEPVVDLRSALEAARADAVAQGYAEGLAETEALRQRLADTLAALEIARGHQAADLAAMVAELSAAVIEAWLAAVPAVDRLRPIVAGWLRDAATPATAHVHPHDADAMRAAVGDAAIEVVGDPAVAAGDAVISGAVFELRVEWRERMAELRELIAAAISAGEDVSA